MFEEELVDLSGYFAGGQALDISNGRGWSMVAAVADMHGDRIIGYLRMEGSATDVTEVAVEFEEALAAA